MGDEFFKPEKPFMLLYGINLGDVVGYSQGWDFFETEDMLKN